MHQNPLIDLEDNGLKEIFMTYGTVTRIYRPSRNHGGRETRIISATDRMERDRKRRTIYTRMMYELNAMVFISSFCLCLPRRLKKEVKLYRRIQCCHFADLYPNKSLDLPIPWKLSKEDKRKKDVSDGYFENLPEDKLEKNRFLCLVEDFGHAFIQCNDGKG